MSSTNVVRLLAEMGGARDEIVTYIISTVVCLLLLLLDRWQHY
jgi:hypothetical protein